LNKIVAWKVLEKYITAEKENHCLKLPSKSIDVSQVRIEHGLSQKHENYTIAYSFALEYHLKDDLSYFLKNLSLL